MDLAEKKETLIELIETIQDESKIDWLIDFLILEVKEELEKGLIK